MNNMDYQALKEYRTKESELLMDAIMACDLKAMDEHKKNIDAAEEAMMKLFHIY